MQIRCEICILPVITLVRVIKAAERRERYIIVSKISKKCFPASKCGENNSNFLSMAEGTIFVSE